MKNPNQLNFLKTDALGNPVTDAAAHSTENTVPTPERSGYRVFVPAANIGDIGKAIQAGGLKHFDDVTESDRALMRQCLTGTTTDDTASPLESFFRDALDCELLLTAYFYPKRFEGLPPSCHPGVMPVTWALRAAGRTGDGHRAERSAPGLRRHLAQVQWCFLLRQGSGCTGAAGPAHG